MRTLTAGSSTMEVDAAEQHPRAGLEHLNAILIARGYIKTPLDFSISKSEDAAPRTDSSDSSRGDKLETIADLLTTILAERDMDLEMKANLAAKVRVLESSLERKGKALAEEIETRLEAQRKETAALVKVGSVTHELSRETASHRSTRDDLLRLRRDVASIKQASVQAKVRAERKSENLRSKLSELSTQALMAKGCAADVRVIGGVFSHAEGSRVELPEQSTAGQLAMDQVKELEEERSKHLDEIIALKMLSVESINALREAGRKLSFHVGYERVELESGDGGKKPSGKNRAIENVLLSSTTNTTAFIGDLFPPQFQLSRANAGTEHPAFTALLDALQEVRHQGDQLEALKSDRSASLQRLLSKAKLKISEEAWNEANGSAHARSSSASASTSASSSSSSISMDELRRQLFAAQEKLKSVQASCERQAQLLEQSEEAHVATRGLLEMYRQREDRRLDVPMLPGLSNKRKDRKGSDVTERRELTEKLKELEEEKQRYIMQRQELEQAKAMLLAERPAEANSPGSVANTPMASKSSSGRMRQSHSSRSGRRMDTALDSAPEQGDASNDLSFSKHVSRKRRRDSLLLQNMQPESSDRMATALPRPEADAGDGTVIDHGEEATVDIWKSASAKLSRFAGIHASGTSFKSSGAIKRKAEGEPDNLQSSSQQQAPSSDAAATSKRLRTERSARKSGSSNAGPASEDPHLSRPPLANHEDVNNDRRRRRSSARIASLSEQAKDGDADPPAAIKSAAAAPTRRKLLGAPSMSGTKSSIARRAKVA
ncbi:hypothetical protein K437DRAFT_147144 [Tilletiaria anomala UBC 951]|uniref:Uncharacterized protein n=1 Tax=Tilletiaria anomala (strain ATCC 24038 / CBS 436.72 / UBC 951) TaxID=1037660 RepID=A0A066VXW4_TILAU|nr:uncharacterized protein K437DRAFT_147144 [Tilletiaria anomala UBC 951]KDN43664.1 hypothetical protein K437DRAFT_147144 [Tilletiaria anomala UBC 951]